MNLHSPTNNNYLIYCVKIFETENSLKINTI